MNFDSVIFIALALAVDAFAVALGAGVTLKVLDFRKTFRLAWHFGFFQAAMNVLGWTAGLTFRQFIEAFDHWVAFGLLGFVGINMIREAISGHEELQKTDPTKGWTLVMLSVATSIDSLAVGLSFSVLNISVWFPALVIGITATALTVIGLHLGRIVSSSSRLGAKVEVAGGIVLIGIGFRILYDHGVFKVML